MTQLEQALRRAAGDLTALGVRFALIGGLAVSVRTEPRFTRDADLAVAIGSDAEAERLIRDLREREYEVFALVEHDAARRLATVRLSHGRSEETPVVDLLFASSGIEAEIVQDAEPVEILPELTVPVARVGHLLTLKLLSRDDEERPQDAIDIRALLRAASSEERRRLRHSAALVTARGFHRGRDLAGAVDRLLGEGRGPR